MTRRFFTSEDDALVLAKDISDDELARKLNRSLASIRTRRYKLLHEQTTEQKEHLYALLFTWNLTDYLFFAKASSSNLRISSAVWKVIFSPLINRVGVPVTPICSPRLRDADTASNTWLPA